MAGNEHGFREFEEQLRDLADRFERMVDEKQDSTEEMVRARDPSGQFITFRDAIVAGISIAIRENAIPQASSEAKQYLPSGSDRGRSSNPQIDQYAEGWVGDRYNHAFYSLNDLVSYHEFGTGQHSDRGTTNATGSAGPGYIIEPRNEDVLSFDWDRVGGRVAFEYVVHPGVRGKHFMQIALEQSTGDMADNIGEKIDNIDFDT